MSPGNRGRIAAAGESGVTGRVRSSCPGSGTALESVLKIGEGDSAGGSVMIQALDVDGAEPGRMAKFAKKTKRRPSDLTDEEWAEIAPLTPKPGRRGRPRQVEFREVINAARCLVRSGCGWRMLPVHFGPWQTVYGWFRELARRFLFQTIQRQGRVPGHPARTERNRVDAEQGRPTLRHRRRSAGDRRGAGDGVRRHVRRSVGRGGSPPLHRAARRRRGEAFVARLGT